MTCAAEGISVYFPHSALDSVWGGTNDWLTKGQKERDAVRDSAGEGNEGI